MANVTEKTSNLIKQMKEYQKNIAENRDKLRELIAEISEIEEDCNDAVDSLEDAADALSRLQ